MSVCKIVNCSCKLGESSLEQGGYCAVHALRVALATAREELAETARYVETLEQVLAAQLQLRGKRPQGEPGTCTCHARPCCCQPVDGEPGT